MRLIEAYTVRWWPTTSPPIAWRGSRAPGSENITFAWAGPLEKGAKHYYRVQGPTFLIEYDNTQNDGNHVHAVWRDFAGDFGRDLLREHVKGGRARIARLDFHSASDEARGPHVGPQTARSTGQTRLRGDQALGQTRQHSLRSNMPSSALRRVFLRLERPTSNSLRNQRAARDCLAAPTGPTGNAGWPIGPTWERRDGRQ